MISEGKVKKGGQNARPTTPRPPPPKPIGPPVVPVRAGGPRFPLLRAILDRLDAPPVRVRVSALERRLARLEAKLARIKGEGQP